MPSLPVEITPAMTPVTMLNVSASRCRSSIATMMAPICTGIR